jgi:hypothetical protein
MPTRSLGVITYLAQDRHSSYGRDSLAILKRSVVSLFEHYNRRARDDVIFFHTGLNATVQQDVLTLCDGSQARFLQLEPYHFETPPTSPPPTSWKQTAQFSAGYRHMIRFYTLGIWEVVQAQEYEYVMRMDEDSLLWSPIRYNLFDFLASRGVEYAYRLAAWEHGFHGFGGEHFFRFPRELVARGVVPNSTGWLLDSCEAGRRNIGNYTLRRCGEPYGIYNNFFISKVSFWFRPDVRLFLKAVNRSQLIYTLRFNDILWHSTAVKLFMEPRQVFMFHDWAYEHITFRNVAHGGGGRTRRWWAQCAQVGAFVLGSDGASYEPARQRARELLRKEACMVAQSVTSRAITYRRVRRCVIAQPHDRSALDAIAFGGGVSTEQPFCDRVPAPYYCEASAPAPTNTTQERHIPRSQIPEARRTKAVCNQTHVCAREGACPTLLKV